MKRLAALIVLCCTNAAALADAGPRCNDMPAAPQRLQLALGKSTVLRLPEPLQQRSTGNPAIVHAMLVGPDALYVLGLDVGSTNLIVQGKSGACLLYDVQVALDTTGVAALLTQLMPEEKGIRVDSAADALVLSGVVADSAASARAAEIAGAFVRRPTRAVGGESKEVQGSGPRVINLLDVGAPQQVMLEVKVAEVSKSLLERIEASAMLSGVSGSWTATLAANFLSGTARGVAGLAKSNGNAFSLAAEKQDGHVRILAEPTVMAISGQEGSFLAGGRIFIPIAQDNNKVTLEEKEFGVGLRFTPTVLAGGRINLRVAPEVSELSREGVGIRASAIGGTSVLPLVTTRRASTTVQLYDGQSFAIGGLVKNNSVANLKAVPLLGELPILGALFRSTDYQQDRSELVFVVTAHLAKPLPPSAPLPTDPSPLGFEVR